MLSCKQTQTYPKQCQLQPFQRSTLSKPQFKQFKTRDQKSQRVFRAIEEQKEGTKNVESEQQQIYVDDDEDLFVEGYYVNRPSILETEWFGKAWKIGFVSISVLAVVILVVLATPVIDNTLQSFPNAEERGEIEVVQEIEEVEEVED
eukprot:TRINITY_DN18649_c0_g1_i2.p3 TRINITY_DN18649_c0_g1~~TRINITY_DN18649_c0_g1_i2.p3  ORF type:complete len:163 (+),score=22.50 TRINITY_DN18649_c0_g1_i2:50-490(+)